MQTRWAGRRIRLATALIVTLTALAFVSVVTPRSTAAADNNDLALVGVPADITTPATSPEGAVVTYTPPTAVDDGVPSTATVTCTAPPGSTFPVGSDLVTCTATDPNGTNSSVSASFLITVTMPVYQAVTPARVTDTRPGSGYPNAGHSLGAGAILNVQVAGVSGVPASGATAVVLNVTATNATQAGYLTVWPAGAARPATSNLNFVAGQTVADLVEVGLGTGGEVSIYNRAGSVNVVVDVQAYVNNIPWPIESQDSSNSIPGLFYNVPPARITDTRPGSGHPNAGHSLGTGGALDVQAAGVAGVPGVPGPFSGDGAGAVVLNVTAVGPTKASHLTVWPSGTARPATSNLNFVPGQTVANRVMVPVGANGKVSIYNLTGTVNVVVDVTGYFTASFFEPPRPGPGFYPVTPARIADTRPSSGYAGAGHTLFPGDILAVQVAGLGGVPASGTTAAVLTVTATNATHAGYLTVWANGTARPRTSDVLWGKGETVANLVVAGLGAGGQILIYNPAGSVNIVVDVSGYYAMWTGIGESG